MEHHRRRGRPPQHAQESSHPLNPESPQLSARIGGSRVKLSATVQPAQHCWCGLDLFWPGVHPDVTQPVKPFASIDEQIDILLARGLDLNRQIAAQWLRNVGYYRLSGYRYPYRLAGAVSASRRDQFTPGASLDDVVRLYEFDRKLRTLIHDGIERVEVALRSNVSYVLGERGPLSYLNAGDFRPSFDHDKWLRTARQRVNRALRHNEAVRHHEDRYRGALPIWVLTEVLDFADVSRLYDGLFVRDQWVVAERMGVQIDDVQLSRNQRRHARRNHPLARWLEQLTIVRNTSAHHSRVWNRSFAPASTAGLRTIPDLHSLPEGQSERLYGSLTVMGHLLQQTSPGTTWTAKVRSLVDESFRGIPGRHVHEMGFPESWQSEQLWSVSRST